MIKNNLDGILYRFIPATDYSDKRETDPTDQERAKQAILRWAAKVLEDVKEQLPTSEQLTTKYGYHMPEKMYGYKLGIHDAREAIDQFEQNLLKALEEV